MMLEGRVVIGTCGCWTIRAYHSEMVLRFSMCRLHVGLALDKLEEMLYLDKVGSVSASVEERSQLWLT